MPSLIMERPKMSLQMHENLKKYILRERKKKKEEDVANEQKMQKMKEEMKRAEMNTHTLEQTREQIRQLEIKLEEICAKKRELFIQLKRILHEESIMKKRPPMQSQPEPILYQPAPFQHQPPVSSPYMQSSPMRFISAPNRPQHFKPETLMQPQPIKRARSPSPPPPLPPPQTVNQIFQTPQHPSLLANQAAMTNAQFQSHLFSPNKKTRVGPQPPNASPLQAINAYSSVIGQQLPQRLPAPYNTAQQSAFSAYPSHLFALHQQQQQQQGKPATILGVPPNSQIHGPPTGLSYGLPPRLTHQGGIPLQSQLDAQKILFQSPQLLISHQHPQSGGILSGFPLQRPQQPPSSHPQQPPFQ